MKLMNKYRLDAEDFEVIANAGVEAKTYLVGTFLSDMCDAGLDDIANELRITDFEVELLKVPNETDPSAECSVALIGLVDETYWQACFALRARFPEKTDWAVVN